MATPIDIGSTQAVTHSYDAGDHLFHQGDLDRGIHRIRKGTVTVYRVTADGHRQIEAFAGPGDYASLCLSATSPTSAEALSDVETEYLSRAAFERLILEDPEFRADIFLVIDKASSDARRQATLLACRCAMERVAAFVVFLEERFGTEGDRYTHIPMSRSEMADYLGLTLETVSRMFSRLKQAEIIELPRSDRFKVKDRARLIRNTGEDSIDRTDRRAG